MLRRHRLELPRDFARVLFVGKHDSTALAVANGTADAGALASYIHEEQGPAIQAKLVILDQSEPIPFGPVVARADLGDALLGRSEPSSLRWTGPHRGKSFSGTPG